MAMLDTPTLHTPRFEMRKLVRQDAAALFPTLSDDAQCLYMSRGAFRSEAELADWLTDPAWPGRTWIAVDRTTRAVAGRYVAFPGRDDWVFEVGYVTVIDHQGRGAAKECMTALIFHLLEREGHRRVYAEIDAENVASIALAESLGLVREGCLREHERTHKGLCDMVIYGALAREWRAP